jgi:hypothetical protein
VILGTVYPDGGRKVVGVNTVKNTDIASVLEYAFALTEEHFAFKKELFQEGALLRMRDSPLRRA